MKIIPDLGSFNGNYWCSWRCQRFSRPILAQNFDEDMSRYMTIDALSDEWLFKKPGMISNYLEDVRGDLQILLDDGWDLPYINANGDEDYWSFGSIELNPKRFPYNAATKPEALYILNKKITDLGYRGTGLWVPMECGEKEKKDNCYSMSLNEFKEYWTEKAKWLDYAGITYIKADWGNHQNSILYRKLLTEIIHDNSPKTEVEHVSCDGFIANDFREALKDDERNEYIRDLIRYSDYYRCYDVFNMFNTATTMNRLALAMLAADNACEAGRKTIINVSEEPYLAAAAGCTMAIMSHPLLRGVTLQLYPERFDNGMSSGEYERSDYHVFDDTRRALKWQRIAPPFGVGATKFIISDSVLNDSWFFEKEPYPWRKDEYKVKGTKLIQNGPSIIARNTELPAVYAEDEVPFVVVSKNPYTDVFTIATLNRTINHKLNNYTPKADIIVKNIDSGNPIGIFGEYKSLTLIFNNDISRRRIFGQDILSPEAEDITDSIKISGNRLVIGGEFIEKFGRKCNVANDYSDPGIAIKII